MTDNFISNIVLWNDFHKTVINFPFPQSIVKIGATESIYISEYIQRPNVPVDTGEFSFACCVKSLSQEDHNVY